MGEADAIDQIDDPNTVTSLVDDFRGLGISPGDTLLVHSSMSALGWVCGDAPAVVDALQDTVTETGTLVMPTHTTQYSDPADWEQPPVPDDWVATIRERRPPYRTAVTPSRGMGAIPECFRCYPETIRSRHPEYSFSAWGAGARSIVADHSYDDGLGEGSPLARFYDRGGDVLLLGVDHERNTSLHLAEYRVGDPPRTVRNTAPVLKGGEVVHVEYEDIETDSSDFAELGAALEATNPVATGTVGAATAKLIDQRSLVDFAVDWMASNR